MKSYTGETMIDNHVSNGNYIEHGFFLYNGDVTLYGHATSNTSEVYVFITLHTSTSVPSNFYCVYSYEYSAISYEEAARYYISNNYTSNSGVSFTSYNGDRSMITSSQNLADSSTSFLLLCFKYWVKDEMKVSLKSIGLFPNF